MVKEFLELLKQSEKIHRKKNADYAANDSPYENFERANLIASWFNKPEDKAFAVLLGVKLARLATLLNSDREPNNESIEDSFLDHFTYSGLWASYRKFLENNKNKDKKPIDSRAIIIETNSKLPDPRFHALTMYYIKDQDKYFMSTGAEWKPID